MYELIIINIFTIFNPYSLNILFNIISIRILQQHFDLHLNNQIQLHPLHYSLLPSFHLLQYLNLNIIIILLKVSINLLILQVLSLIYRLNMYRKIIYTLRIIILIVIIAIQIKKLIIQFNRLLNNK